MQRKELQKNIKKILLENTHLFSSFINEQRLPPKEKEKPFDPTFGTEPSVLHKAPKATQAAPKKKITKVDFLKDLESVINAWKTDDSPVPEETVQAIIELSIERMLKTKKVEAERFLRKRTDMVKKVFGAVIATKFNKELKEQLAKIERMREKHLKKTAFDSYKKDPLKKHEIAKLLIKLTKVQRHQIVKPFKQPFKLSSLKPRPSFGTFLVLSWIAYTIEGTKPVPEIEYESPWPTLETARNKKERAIAMLMLPIELFFGQSSSQLESEVKHYDPLYVLPELIRSGFSIRKYQERQKLQRKLAHTMRAAAHHREKYFDKDMGRWKPGYGPYQLSVRKGDPAHYAQRRGGAVLAANENNFPCVYRSKTRGEALKCEGAEVLKDLWPRAAEKLDKIQVGNCRNYAKILKNIWGRFKEQIMADSPDSPRWHVPKNIVFPPNATMSYIPPEGFSREEMTFVYSVIVKHGMPSLKISSEQTYNFGAWLDVFKFLCSCKPACPEEHEIKIKRNDGTTVERKIRIKNDKRRWNECNKKLMDPGQIAMYAVQLNKAYSNLKRGKINSEQYKNIKKATSQAVFAYVHNSYRRDHEGCGVQFDYDTEKLRRSGQLVITEKKPEKALRSTPPWIEVRGFSLWHRILARMSRDKKYYKLTPKKAAIIKRRVEAEEKRRWEKKNLISPPGGVGGATEYWCARREDAEETKIFNAILAGPNKEGHFWWTSDTRRGSIMVDAYDRYEYLLEKFTKNFKQGTLYKENEACEMKFFKLLIKAHYDAINIYGRKIKKWKLPEHDMMKALFGKTWEELKDSGMSLAKLGTAYKEHANESKWSRDLLKSMRGPRYGGMPKMGDPCKKNEDCNYRCVGPDCPKDGVCSKRSAKLAALGIPDMYCHKVSKPPPCPSWRRRPDNSCKHMTPAERRDHADCQPCTRSNGKIDWGDGK